MRRQDVRRRLLAMLAAAALLAGGGHACAGAEAADPGFRLHETPLDLPQIRFQDGTGAERSLADFRGKLVLLNLWATWCVPCREEMPTLARLQEALGGPDFAVVALSFDRKGSGPVRDFYAKLGLRALDVYVDPSGKAMRELGVKGLPTTLLVDARGREIGRYLGAAEWDSPEMVALIRGRLDGGKETHRGRPHATVARE